MLAARIRILVAGVAVVVLAPVAPANADDPDDVETDVTFVVNSGTETSFEVSGGPLSVSAPVSVALGDAAPASSVGSPLGTVTVSDTRALLAPAWTAAVSSTDFTTGGGTADETIPAADVNYWSGPETASSGTNTVFVPGQPTSSDQVAVSTSPVAFSLTAGLGNNSVSWNPTLLVTIPADAVSGLYTATVTHSAA